MFYRYILVNWRYNNIILLICYTSLTFSQHNIFLLRLFFLIQQFLILYIKTKLLEPNISKQFIFRHKHIVQSIKFLTHPQFICSYPAKSNLWTTQAKFDIFEWMFIFMSILECVNLHLTWLKIDVCYHQKKVCFMFAFCHMFTLKYQR